MIPSPSPLQPPAPYEPDMSSPLLTPPSSTSLWSSHPQKTPINPFVATLPHLLLFLALALPSSNARLPLRFLFFPAILVSHNYVITHYTTGIAAGDYGLCTFAATMMMKSTDFFFELGYRPQQRFFRTEEPGPVPSTFSNSVEDQLAQPSTREPEGAWERMKWALGLLTSMRGVGWNWQAKNIPPPSKQSRVSFVITQSIKFCLLYVGMDLLSNFMQSHPYFTSRASIPPASVLDALLIRVAALLAGYGALNTQYTLLSVIGVAVGWGEVKDWRPLFGFGGVMKGERGMSVGRFWSEIWHQSYQRSLTTMSSLLSTSPLPSLIFPFVFSAGLHHAGTKALLGSHASFLHSPTVHFFLLQPYVILFERLVLFKFLGRGNLLMWVWTVGWILGSGGLICEENVRGGLWTVEVCRGVLLDGFGGRFL